MKTYIFPSVFCLTLLTACGEKKNADSTQNSIQIPQSEESTAIHVKIVTTTHYKSIVDDLRVRDTPDLNGKVIDKATYGTLFTDLKQKSDNEVEVELQGEKKKATFYKVKTKSGKEGWVHGAAVKAVVVAPHYLLISDIDNAAVDKYKNAVAKLNPNLPESFQKALTEYDNLLGAANPSTCERAYIVLRDFGMAVTEKSFEWNAWEKYNDSDKHKDLWIQSPKNTINMAYDDFFKKLAVNGLWVSQAEGAFFVVPDPAAVAKHVAMKCTNAMRDYLAQVAKETKFPTAEDNGLIVNPKEVAERMLFWENFAQKNERFVLRNECENDFRDNLTMLIFGLNNSPAFDYDSKELQPEFRDAYEWLVREHSSSRGGSAVNSFYTILKINKLKINPLAEARRREIEEKEYPLLELE
jgi:Bacterial SH3 domain